MKSRRLGICLISALLAVVELSLAYVLDSNSAQLHQALDSVEPLTPHYAAMFKTFAWLHLAASILLAVIFALVGRNASQ